MVFYRSHLEVIPDVKFKLKIMPFLKHTINGGILVLVQLNVRYSGKRLKGPVPHILSVSQGPDGHFGGLDETKNSGFHHLTIVYCWFITIGKQDLFGCIPAVLAPVFPALHHILFSDFRIDQFQGITKAIRLRANIYGKSIVLSIDKHPGSFELS